MSQNVPSLKPKFADLADAGPSRGLSVRQLRAWIRDGFVPGYRPNNGKILVDLDELDRFIRSKRYDPGSRIDRLVDVIVDEVRAEK